MKIRRRARPHWSAIGLACLLAACGEAGSVDRRPDDRLSPVKAMATADVEGYLRATTPREFTFPRDHGPHPRYRLEWWYFVGNLETGDGRRFGCQLTFFRQALAPGEPAERSAWASHQIYMAHFALSDVDGGRFHSGERFSRAALGLAGARSEPFRVWLEDWAIESEGATFLPLRLRAEDGGRTVELWLTTSKPPVLQGEDGLSRKSSEPGNASYYYSLTRLEARGTVRLGDRDFEVTGNGWLDREWSTSVLQQDQVGWDWFALQLDDGRDLMFYQLRLRDGSVEPLSHGVVVAPDGSQRKLELADVELSVERTWRSPRGGRYPAGWRLRVPSEELALEVEPLLDDQELDVTFRYWEGAVGVRGTGAAGPVAGRGYVELVGYADE